MAEDDKAKNSNLVPIRFLDSEESAASESDSNLEGNPDQENEIGLASEWPSASGSGPLRDPVNTGSLQDPHTHGAGEPSTGPLMAELVGTRAELKRVQREVAELNDKLLRRQADFENFRKRVERERTETYNHVVADLAAKLLPVVDNLRRALDSEASIEASESDEFRHFLSGVDLIQKQLSSLLETMGITVVASVGERFDPHIHEAVVTEETDAYEPDTVIQEIVRGYRLGDKLIRPALVKVAVRSQSE
jgi:molecular chaperone GrpE